MDAWVYKQIGNKVAYYRRMRGLTQEELARRISISVSSLSKVERGGYNHNVPMSMLIAIAKGLHIELSTLVTFSADEKEMFWEAASHQREKDS